MHMVLRTFFQLLDFNFIYSLLCVMSCIIMRIERAKLSKKKFSKMETKAINDDEGRVKGFFRLSRDR